MPLITVLMTVYNGMPYLPLAIDSILNQTISNFKFVIINDCSTDRTRDIIKSYNDTRIQVIDNDKNIGQTKSLNKGLEYVETDLVARMDADDISHPRRLEHQVNYLNEFQDIAVVGTSVRMIDPSGKVIRKYQFPERDIVLRWLQLFDSPVACGAAVFKKSIVWDKLKGFDSSVRYAQDWELWSRVLPNNKMANVPKMLLDVREHPDSSSISSNNIVLEEKFQINRLNPVRVLGIHNDSDEWYQKVDTLLSNHITNPKDRITVINTFFRRFCELYPNVSENPEVLRILSRQYIKAIYHSNIKALPKAIMALLKSRVLLSQNYRIFLCECLLSICEIPNKTKYWVRRNLLGSDL